MKKPVRWFLSLYDDDQLDLEPPYQRRSVWTPKDRRFFLDTVFKNFPCPAIFLYQKTDIEMGKMVYHVVDGKQRLETLIAFRDNKIAIDKTSEDGRLSGKSWKEIDHESGLIEHFLNYPMPVEFIEISEGLKINEIFDRLNRNSRRLERQELRHAKFDGWFITVSEKEALKEEWEQLGLSTKTLMRRMRDVQHISELLAVVLKDRILGYDQDMLDDLYAKYDSPLETLEGFNEREFSENLEFAKGYILRMEHHNRTVTQYSGGFANFYSLWSFVHLNRRRLESPEVTADRYAGFMNKVAALAKSKSRCSGGRDCQ